MLHTPMATRGMVVAPHHLAAQAGIRVLRDGGNAIEAMVAAAATITVVYPHMNSLGGDSNRRLRCGSDQGRRSILPPSGLSGYSFARFSRREHRSRRGFGMDGGVAMEYRMGGRSSTAPAIGRCRVLRPRRIPGQPKPEREYASKVRGTWRFRGLR